MKAKPPAGSTMFGQQPTNGVQTPGNWTNVAPVGDTPVNALAWCGTTMNHYANGHPEAVQRAAWLLELAQFVDFAHVDPQILALLGRMALDVKLRHAFGKAINQIESITAREAN